MVYFHYNAFQWWVQSFVKLWSCLSLEVRQATRSWMDWNMITQLSCTYLCLENAREWSRLWVCFHGDVATREDSVPAELLKRICELKHQTARVSRTPQVPRALVQPPQKVSTKSVMAHFCCRLIGQRAQQNKQQQCAFSDTTWNM